MGTRNVILLAVVAVVVWATATAAARLSKTEAIKHDAVSVIANTSSFSPSGRAFATFYVIGDSSDPANAYAVFQVVSVRNSAGLLASSRRVVRLSEVAWPQTLIDTEDWGTLATAVFSNDSGSSAADVAITVTDG